MRLCFAVTAALILNIALTANTGAQAQLIISEFRYNGTNGPNDEFIEIYNNSGADFTVNAADASAGFAVVSSDGVARFIIPNGTVIPNRGHYLGCNSVSYSLTSYPAGNGTTATCDATYTLDIPINSGLALFNTANPLSFTLANRLDAVGSTAEANTLYKEGTGVRNLNAFPVNYSYYRRGTGGCIGTNPGTADSNCTNTSAINGTAGMSSNVQDTNNNRSDFLFVDTNGTQTSSEASQQRLGAPGPENLSSPIQRNLATALVDPCVSSSASPNRVRDLTNDPAEPNDTFGSLFIRRKFTNNTGANVTRLRFRIIDITTFPSAVFSLPPPPNDFCGAPGSDCAADLRALTSTDVIVSVSAACGGGSATVRGTTLEQAASPNNQPNGGGYNSTLSAGTVTLATPLANGASIDVQFRFGVQQQGKFRVFVKYELLP
ncbi:MAG TPA: hypothetical protein VER08_10180 [Pyrinomonadaceae bacterium]|nr:hypothetical protein [Pyrinomonadaceae bacterium]